MAKTLIQIRQVPWFRSANVGKKSTETIHCYPKGLKSKVLQVWNDFSRFENTHYQHTKPIFIFSNPKRGIFKPYYVAKVWNDNKLRCEKMVQALIGIPPTTPALLFNESLCVMQFKQTILNVSALLVLLALPWAIKRCLRCNWMNQIELTVKMKIESVPNKCQMLISLSVIAEGASMHLRIKIAAKVYSQVCGEFFSWIWTRN